MNGQICKRHSPSCLSIGTVMRSPELAAGRPEGRCAQALGFSVRVSLAVKGIHGLTTLALDDRSEHGCQGPLSVQGPHSAPFGWR